MKRFWTLLFFGLGCIGLFGRMAPAETLSLATLRQEAPRLVLAKHFNLGGSHYTYTEGLSDAQSERHFLPGSQLCLLEVGEDGAYHETVLLDAPNGVIRDPDLTADGTAIVFAWKKSDREDDYHLYRMSLETREVEPLTFGLGWADYEPCCLPNGDILFNSTRCMQIVDCWWTEVSNFYLMDANGQHMRRIAFDQVHDNYPTLTDDGRVIYTRWEYNDRGQIFPQGLFQMNTDGTAQTELYGNNSWFPTSILHARAIPGTGKYLCIFSGHHTRQRGKLGLLDPSLGRQENQGATLIAPVRPTPAEKIDTYGQDGEQFCYPVPITEETFLVAYRENAEKNPTFPDQAPFSIYYMNMAGEKILVASDTEGRSCLQVVPVKPKTIPQRPSTVDWTQNEGIYYMQDVFAGPGLEGVPREKVRSLRVVTLGSRVAGIGLTTNIGKAGGGLSATPPATGNATWDTKKVLGEAKIYADGSACFRVPARTPVYFQVVDIDGHVIQTMRSWSTLQPGERFACIGCHEDKNEGILTSQAATQAMKVGPQALEPFYGEARWFSFSREIQPILDRHCTSCHNDSNRLPPYGGGESVRAADGSWNPETGGKPFSLLAKPFHDVVAKRYWSEAYLNLTNSLRSAPDADPLTGNACRGRVHPAVCWLDSQSVPSMLAPYTAGSARSLLCTTQFEGATPHHGVHLSQEEKDKIACWVDLLVPFCDTYEAHNAWSPEEKARYEHFWNKRLEMEALEAKMLRKRAGAELETE